MQVWSNPQAVQDYKGEQALTNSAAARKIVPTHAAVCAQPGGGAQRQLLLSPYIELMTAIRNKRRVCGWSLTMFSCPRPRTTATTTTVVYLHLDTARRMYCVCCGVPGSPPKREPFGFTPERHRHVGTMGLVVHTAVAVDLSRLSCP